MARIHREDILFIGLSALVFLAMCVLTAAGMIRLIQWTLGNCGDSLECKAADSLISYWWALFVPAVLLVAYAFNRVYQARLVRRKAQQK